MAIIKKTVNKKAVMARALAAKKARAVASRKRRRIRQTLDRFIVVAIGTNASGTPKDTTGWTASLIRTGNPTITADFDDFGVVRFPTVTTLTTVPYLLTLRDENGNAIRSFNVPSDREFFVARF